MNQKNKTKEKKEEPQKQANQNPRSGQGGASSAISFFQGVMHQQHASSRMAVLEEKERRANELLTIAMGGER